MAAPGFTVLAGPTLEMVLYFSGCGYYSPTSKWVNSPIAGSWRNRLQWKRSIKIRARNGQELAWCHPFQSFPPRGNHEKRRAAIVRDAVLCASTRQELQGHHGAVHETGPADRQRQALGGRAGWPVRHRCLLARPSHHSLIPSNRKNDSGVWNYGFSCDRPLTPIGK